MGAAEAVAAGKANAIVIEALAGFAAVAVQGQVAAAESVYIVVAEIPRPFYSSEVFLSAAAVSLGLNVFVFPIPWQPAVPPCVVSSVYLVCVL